MLDKAIPFLEAQAHSELGEACLAGIALLNENYPKEHPKLLQIAQRCKAEAADLRDADVAIDIYNTGLAVVFLCAYDAVEQKALINDYIYSLKMRQKPHGGWGYQHGEFAASGDTSQTQFAILALWYAQHKGAITFPTDSVVNVCNWLLATQDPSGGWGYQGKLAGDSGRVPQDEVRHSLCAAGLSGVYLCANMLHLTRGPRSGDAPNPQLGPLRLVQGDANQEAPGSWLPRTKNVSLAKLKSSMQLGQRWFDQHFTMGKTEWRYYYMYAYERYESFREIAEGTHDTSPEWYRQGVAVLQSLQQPDGSWTSDHTADTAFAVLFLQRNMQRVLDTVRDGRLTGGRGLPANLQEARLLGGKVAGKRFEGTLNELLSRLESQELSPEFEVPASDLPTWSDMPENQEQQRERLRRIVRGHEQAAARLAAVQLLVQAHSLDEVPTLIHALTDPDPQVLQAASQGLRVLSRKLEGDDLPLQPTAADVQKAVQSWQTWYRSLRPQAVFAE